MVEAFLQDDGVIGGVGGPALVAVAGLHHDVVVVAVLQHARGLVGERLDHLDAVDIPDQPGEEGGVVTGAGAGLEHGVVGLELGEVGHERDQQRGREVLAVADRQRVVVVGERLDLRRHEIVARHGAHGLKHARIDRPDAGLAREQAHLLLDDRDHVVPGDLVRRFGAHLGGLLLHRGSSRQRQRQGQTGGKGDESAASDRESFGHGQTSPSTTRSSL